jgi:uncharacterized protein
MRTAPGVEAYGGGGFRVAGTRIDGSILILADDVRPWPPTSSASLTAEDFADVFAADRAAVEFVLLGTGADVAPVPAIVRAALRDEGIGLEVMSTPEASRLYNILAADGRRMACALIALGAPRNRP